MIKAGKEEPAHSAGGSSRPGRGTKLDAFEKAGKLKKIPFADRAQMKKLADPVMAEYAKEIGADAIYNKINSM